MKRIYIAPKIVIVNLEHEGLIAVSGYRTLMTTTSSADNDVNVTYDGINHMGIGNGGFLDTK